MATALWEALGGRSHVGCKIDIHPARALGMFQCNDVKHKLTFLRGYGVRLTDSAIKFQHEIFDLSRKKSNMSTFPARDLAQPGALVLILSVRMLGK